MTPVKSKRHGNSHNKQTIALLLLLISSSFISCYCQTEEKLTENEILSDKDEDARANLFDRLVSQVASIQLATAGESRPFPLSCMSDYPNWSSLHDQTYYGRQLPPASSEYIDSLPPLEETRKLFIRPNNQEKLSKRSTMILPTFANHLTGGFIKSTRGPDGSYQYGRTHSNHNIDLLQLYGRTQEQTLALRLRDNTTFGKKGRLKSQILNGGEEWPPFLYKDGRIDPQFEVLDPIAHGMSHLVDIMEGDRSKFFAMGSNQQNMLPQNIAMTTLFLREHNRVAGELERRYSDWDDDRIFETARNIVIVIYLKIVIEEYINHISPLPDIVKFLVDPGPWMWNAEWNKPNWISAEFAILYRWHALMPNKVMHAGIVFDLSSTLFQHDLLLGEDRSLKKTFVDMSAQRSASCECLNTAGPLVEREVESLRYSRALRFRPYVEYVEYWGLKKPRRFEDITKNAEVASMLRDLYGTVDKVEFFVGLIASDHSKNGIFGSSMNIGVGLDAFSQALTNPLLSEHVWKEETFSPYGWDLVNQEQTIAALVERNSPGDKVSNGDVIGFDYIASNGFKFDEWEAPSASPSTNAVPGDDNNAYPATYPATTSPTSKPTISPNNTSDKFPTSKPVMEPTRYAVPQAIDRDATVANPSTQFEFGLNSGSSSECSTHMVLFCILSLSIVTSLMG